MAPSSPLRVQYNADGDSSSSDPSPSSSMTASTTLTLASLPSGPPTPTAGVSSPLLTSVTPPASKTSFQLDGASEIDRPWVRSALLSPTRCSSQFFDDGPYAVAELEAPRPPYARSFSDTSSMSSRFSLLPDPSTWGSATHYTDAEEPDDELHIPDPERDKTVDKGGTIWTARGVSNLGCMLLMCVLIFGLFVGFPITYHFTHKHPIQLNGNNTRTNSTGQVPISSDLVNSTRRAELYDLDPGER